MANLDKIKSMIQLIERFRFETDETKLPSDFNRIIHPAGGKIELGYYEDELVCGFDQDFWEFDKNATWVDFLKALQTTHQHCEEIVDIIPNETTEKQSCAPSVLGESIAAYYLKIGDMEKYNKQVASNKRMKNLYND